MFQVKLSEGTAARRRIPILLVDATDGYTPETGITTPTIKVSKNGGTQATGTGTFTEIGTGQYYYEFASGEVDTLGWVTFNLQKAGCRDYNAIIQVMAYDAMDAVRLGLTALPNANAASAGGLLTSGTGSHQINASAGVVDANAIQISGDATAADNLEAAADGTGYNLGGGQIVAASVSGAVNSVTTGVTVATNNDKTGYSLATAPPTAAAIADAVWDETLADHLTSGSTGAALNAAGSSGDPWATALPGSYGAGTAGKIVGDNLNATVSSRLASADISLSGGAVTVGTINADVITADSIADNAITAASIAGNAITSAKIANDAITAAKIANNAIGSTELADGAITAAKFAQNAINYNVLAADTIDYDKMTENSRIYIANQVWLQDVRNDMDTNPYPAYTFGQRVLRGESAQASVSVTGSHHVAADIHEVQPGTFVDADYAAGSTYSKLATLIEADPVSGYRYTAQALEEAPAGGGGGGGSTTVRMGPFEVRAEGQASDLPLDINKTATHGIDCILVDAQGTGVDLTGATLSTKVYNTSGTLVATISGTATYAAGGAMTWTIPTSVTNTAGTYTATITRTTGASDTEVFGPLRIYVRDI